MRIGNMKFHPYWRVISNGCWERESQYHSEIRSPEVYTGSSRWSYTLAHTPSTKWSQWVFKKDKSTRRWNGNMVVVTGRRTGRNGKVSSSDQGTSLACMKFRLIHETKPRVGGQSQTATHEGLVRAGKALEPNPRTQVWSCNSLGGGENWLQVVQGPCVQGHCHEIPLCLKEMLTNFKNQQTYAYKWVIARKLSLRASWTVAFLFVVPSSTNLLKATEELPHR